MKFLHDLSSLAFVVTLFSISGCGSGGKTGALGIPGEPGDGPQAFITDPNEGGRTLDLRLVEVFWGRLVDVYDIDAEGNVNSKPIFRDFAVRESLFSDGVNLSMETNPITQKTRVVLLRSRAEDPENFDREISVASQPLSPVLPRNDDGSSAPPFSYVARNGALVLRFNDALDDSAEAQLRLADLVRVMVGYRPNTPFAGRIFFDANHGVLVDTEFHSTRVIIDLTVSETDALNSNGTLPLNSTGLPASQRNNALPNVSIRIPTRVDFGSGQFDLLRALSGTTIGADPGEPVDLLGVTRDVVRAFRSGNANDVNRGVMSDFKLPEIVGSWPMHITSVEDDPEGQRGFDFSIDVTFDTVCQAAPRIGDILRANQGLLLEVRQIGQLPDFNGEVSGVLVRALTEEGIDNPFVLVSGAVYLTTYANTTPIPRACWIEISPQAANFPGGGLSTETHIGIRFTEPMRPETVTPFQSFMLVRGSSNIPSDANNIVVGRVNPSGDLRAFTFAPVLPLPHSTGLNEAFSLRLDGPTDIAGNPLATPLPFIDLQLDRDQATVSNSSTVLTFSSLDEIEPIGFDDFRGQFFFDAERGVIKPRPVTRFSAPVDDSNPLPSIMVPFPRPIQTPLTGLGSKLQAVWRYADLGWEVTDETRHNIDVVGLNWAPLNGLLVSDVYPEFEIVLAHSRRLPDEAVDGALLPVFPNSGLLGRENFFADNILRDPHSPPTIVHPRGFGYVVDPAQRFVSSSGTTMMPFPINQHFGPMSSYTWRDTAVLARGGPQGTGIPLAREVNQPLLLDPGPAGRIARRGDVPSFGLPLLMEFRTYPTSAAVGLNGFSISLALNSSRLPALRSFSTGGLNRTSQIVIRDPDLEDRPQGAFNPLSSPPGRRTPANDNGLYWGQLDFVTRVSRSHSAWIDTRLMAARFLDPVVQPQREDQPPGTEVIVEYRGATGFGFDPVEDPESPFDARQLDPYGEMFRVDDDNLNQHVGNIRFVDDVATWSDHIETIDGARFLQIRLSFINNIVSGQNPELSALGFAYQPQ